MGTRKAPAAGSRVEGLAREKLAPTSFFVAPGECTPVVGPSGSGETLLLRAIADLDPNRGEVFAGKLARAAVPPPMGGITCLLRRGAETSVRNTAHRGLSRAGNFVSSVCAVR